MTRDEYERAHKLSIRLIQMMDDWLQGDDIPEHDIAPHDRVWVQDMRKIARKLQAMVVPPPTMEQILNRVPGETIGDKAHAIGVSRQHFYSLAKGTARRSAAVAKSLANLTGVPESTIREIW